MAFALSGPGTAVDDETGVSIRSLGARGPEIETHHWSANIGELNFEFTTEIGHDGDQLNGKRRVWIWPHVDLIDYLKGGPGELIQRNAIVDRMVEGIYFLFPTYFRLPIYFSKGAAVTTKTAGAQVRFETIDAPGSWDAERVTH